MIKNHGRKSSLPKKLNLISRLKNSLIIKDKEYTPLCSLTPRFMELYSKYIKSKRKTEYPSITSILNDYRAEKLNKLSEQEAMREEIGEAIKKYKDIHDVIKRKGYSIDKEKYYKSFGEQEKNRVKENRGIVLDTFYKYDNKIMQKKNKYFRDFNDKQLMKIVSPYKVFKIDKDSLEERIKNKYNNKTSVYFNSKKILELIDNTIKEKPKTRDGKRIRIKDCWDYCHHKINSYCDKITDDSIKLKINGRKTMERFNKTWNKYKIIQEFKNPETKRHIYEKI